MDTFQDLVCLTRHNHHVGRAGDTNCRPSRVGGEEARWQQCKIWLEPDAEKVVPFAPQVRAIQGL